MDSTIERQVIRTAVTLAAISGQGSSPEIVADFRDESASLMELSFNASNAPEKIIDWCGGATKFLDRILGTNAIPEEQSLRAMTTVLRLRLIVTRHLVDTGYQLARKTKSGALEKKPRVLEEVVEPVNLVGNIKKVFEYIKIHPNIRMKEIVENFESTFSARSTKRYVADLVAGKLIHRKEHDDGAVAYFRKD